MKTKRNTVPSNDLLIVPNTFVNLKIPSGTVNHEKELYEVERNSDTTKDFLAPLVCKLKKT